MGSPPNVWMFRAEPDRDDRPQVAFLRVSGAEGSGEETVIIFNPLALDEWRAGEVRFKMHATPTELKLYKNALCHRSFVAAKSKDFKIGRKP
jgi:hypothetical protein